MGITVNHRTFVLERNLPGSPRHAFRFWSDHKLKRQWTSCHPDWLVVEDSFNFEVDGKECIRWRMPDQTKMAMVAHFLEIAPATRLVYAYAMRSGTKTISSSLVTVEFTASAGNTLMTWTEQAVFDSVATGDMRESGTGVGLNRLIEAMAAGAPA
jgi:uncharacterized protein YndB with AHSA1/START domain